ncbi:MAG: hypothetical protein JXR68_00455 [Bacteroidales bacterium]|nr:hypothetical protein [Bacteroidales bacterium]
MFGIFALTFIVILFINFFKAVYDIYSGRLSFSQEIGWIDWKHAIPCGSNTLIENYKYKSNLSQPFVINYEQRQKEFFYKMNAGINFQVESCTNDTVNLYYIFTNVGTFFEERQSKVPILHSRLRSLGDENGNNISFYCAITSTSLEDFKKSVDFESNSKSVFRLFKYFLFLDKNSTLTLEYNPNYQVVKFVNYIKHLKESVNNCNVEILNRTTQIFIFDKKLIEKT